MIRRAFIALLLLAPPAPGADLTRSDVKVAILVDQDTSRGRFHDVIYIDKATFDVLTNAQVDSMKRARADAWVAFVTAESARSVVVTKEEYQDYKAYLQAEITATDAKIATAPTKTPTPTPTPTAAPQGVGK